MIKRIEMKGTSLILTEDGGVMMEYAKESPDVQSKMHMLYLDLLSGTLKLSNKYKDDRYARLYLEIQTAISKYAPLINDEDDRQYGQSYCALVRNECARKAWLWMSTNTLPVSDKETAQYLKRMNMEAAKKYSECRLASVKEATDRARGHKYVTAAITQPAARLHTYAGSETKDLTINIRDILKTEKIMIRLAEQKGDEPYMPEYTAEADDQRTKEDIIEEYSLGKQVANGWYKYDPDVLMDYFQEKFTAASGFKSFTELRTLQYEPEYSDITINVRKIPKRKDSADSKSGKKAQTGKREDYISWDEYFLGIAYLSAQRSKDPNTQVGACIVSEDNKILSMGYNGFPAGCSDDEFPWGKEHAEDDPYNAKYFYSTHSELNAILNYRGGSLAGSKMYVTLFPCNECAKAIIQSGIRALIYAEDKYKDTPSVRASKRMLNAAGVKFEQWTPTGRVIKITV